MNVVWLASASSVLERRAGRLCGCRVRVAATPPPVEIVPGLTSETSTQREWVEKLNALSQNLAFPMCFHEWPVARSAAVREENW